MRLRWGGVSVVKLFDQSDEASAGCFELAKGFDQCWYFVRLGVTEGVGERLIGRRRFQSQDSRNSFGQ